MNTRPPIEAPNEPAALSVAFNNDNSRFAVGLDSGFGIFQSSTCRLQASKDFNAGIGLVQMMGNANYLALVGGGRSPKFPSNKVIIWDGSKNKIALEISTLTSVRGVQLSKSRVVVVLQNSVRVYAFVKQPTPLAVYETADNQSGLCCLTDKYLVFPGRTPGQVQVVHLSNESVTIIPAHNSGLRAIQLSTDGELLATASEKGTLLRVFSTHNGAKVAERRRGTEAATIYSVRFSPSGALLACTSDKGSLHVFDVASPRLNSASSGRPHSPGVVTGTSPADAKSRWGVLSNIPFGVFQDVYSFASAKFELGDDRTSSFPIGDSSVLGTSKPIKGVIGWLDESSLLVIGAGTSAKWEKFILGESEDGRFIAREGWRRYLGR